MNTLRNKQRRAFAVLEYVMLVLILLMGLVGFRIYIERGFQGQFRKAGESFGFLRQYNPGASRDCAFEPSLGIWYETGCFNNEIIRRRCKEEAAGPAYDLCIDDSKKACRMGCTS